MATTKYRVAKGERLSFGRTADGEKKCKSKIYAEGDTVELTAEEAARVPSRILIEVKEPTKKEADEGKSKGKSKSSAPEKEEAAGTATPGDGNEAAE